MVSSEGTILYETDMAAFERLPENHQIRRQLPADYRKRIEKATSSKRKTELAASGALLVYAISQQKRLTAPETVLLLNRLLTYGPHGKPDLNRNLHFNISHSGAKVLLALSDQPVGVDIQQILPLNAKRKASIGRNFFTGQEAELLHSCAGEKEQNLLFFRLWTMKESYIKATGEGFSRPLDSFEISPDYVNASMDCPAPSSEAVNMSRLHQAAIRMIVDLEGREKDRYVCEYRSRGDIQDDSPGSCQYARSLCLPVPSFPEIIQYVSAQELVSCFPILS